MKRVRSGRDGGVMPEVLTYGPMKIHRNVDVPMRDSARLKANVYLPEAPGPHPVVMNFGPYGKDIPLSSYMPGVWELAQQRYPEILASSSCRYVTWEAPDPEVWTRFGYACVRVDSRGSGKSPGYLKPDSPEEMDDFYDAIEWAGSAQWSSGRVGLLGISYYACSQWLAAERHPPHLAAILPWQGTSDFYRDRVRQDGIFCNGFVEGWWENTVITNQYGNAATPYVDVETGGPNTGGPPMSQTELREHRSDYVGDVLRHPLLDDWNAARSADLAKVEVPALVVANWGSLGLHVRGTVLGWQDVSSPEKWLRVQTGPYFLTFYEPRNVELQRRFFDAYLKGDVGVWAAEPPVQLEIRSVDDGIHRVVTGDDWPLSDVTWTRLYLDAGEQLLTPRPPDRPASRSYPALSEGATFSTSPLPADLEFAGPLKASLWVASDTPDMDLFVTVQVLDPLGNDVVFLAATDPTIPVSQGWLRVSHRQLDEAASTEYQPVRRHSQPQPLTPGQVYEVDVSLWPASLHVPAGYRLAITVQGTDFVRSRRPDDPPAPEKPFVHDHPQDRPAAVFGGTHTVHTGAGTPSYLLLPVLRLTTDPARVDSSAASRTRNP